MSYISVVLRRLVTERAGEQCEYCLFPQTASLFAFEMEHIIAEKHDGTTDAENLALACPCCNRFKGSDLGSIDRETQQLTPFFHPPGWFHTPEENYSVHFSGLLLLAPNSFEGV
jgi:HNH endonuclease